MKTAIELKVWLIRQGLYGVDSRSQTLVSYKVSVDANGRYTCEGNSMHVHCWPFSKYGTCHHIDAVAAHLAPEPIVDAVAALKAERAATLESLFDYSVPLTPAEKRVAKKYERVKEAW